MDYDRDGEKWEEPCPEGAFNSNLYDVCLLAFSWNRSGCCGMRMVTGLLTTSGMFSASQTELFCIQTIFGETKHFLSHREMAQLIFENSIYENRCYC